jgi:hypothetical protein
VMMLAALAIASLLDCGIGAGWQQRGPARMFEGDKLFEYMDGNSEGYLVYGFQRMHGVTCVKGDETLIIDVSEFPDGESAYGMFLSNRDMNQPIDDIGTGGQVKPGKAIFAKDKYFVEIAAEKDGDRSAELRRMALAYNQRIEGSTARAEAFNWFPPGMDGGAARLVPESVLGIRALKRGYLAQYGAGKAFVVTEATPMAASAVMTKLRARFSGARDVAVTDDSFEVNDPYLEKICIFRKGSRVAGYANVPETQNPVTLAQQLAARLP